MTFQVIAGLPPGQETTDLVLQDGGLPGGGFFSAVTFLPQTIDYQGATYGLPSVQNYDYVGTITTCASVCDAYASLGGPGSANAVPSYLIGFVQIAADPDGIFGSR